MIDISALIDKTYNHLIDRLLNKKGIFVLERQGDNLFDHHILPDLGDFAPFLLAINKPDVVFKHITFFKNIAPKGVLKSDFSTFGIKGLAKSYEYTDLILGLIDIWKAHPTKENEDLLRETVNTCVQIFGHDKKKINSFFMPFIGLKLPVVDTRDGGFIELYTELFRLLKEERFLTYAQNIYNNLTKNSFFKKHFLFSDFFFSVSVLHPLSFFIKRFNQGDICKNTTNTLFGFLDLYRITKDESVKNKISDIIFSLKSNASKEGGILKTYSVEKSRPFLTASFAVMDFLCDWYKETGDSFALNFAEEIAQFWIRYQGKTGLFPLYVNTKETFIDSETDMIIALSKLAELTYNYIYKESAQKCFEGFVRFHTNQNFALVVDCDTGTVIDSTERTKFVALSLKTLLLFQSGNKIYEDQMLFNILKDR